MHRSEGGRRVRLSFRSFALRYGFKTNRSWYRSNTGCSGGVWPPDRCVPRQYAQASRTDPHYGVPPSAEHECNAARAPSEVVYWSTEFRFNLVACNVCTCLGLLVRRETRISWMVWAMATSA